MSFAIELFVVSLNLSNRLFLIGLPFFVQSGAKMDLCVSLFVGVLMCLSVCFSFCPFWLAFCHPVCLSIYACLNCFVCGPSMFGEMGGGEGGFWEGGGQEEEEEEGRGGGGEAGGGEAGRERGG